ALRCPFRDRAFEVVFSNSLIEHIGTWEEQRQFAVEIRRLAECYFLQTPNRWFPIEPHCLAPLVQFVPKRVRPWVAAWLTPAGWLVPSRQQFQREMQRVRLLTAKEMRELFPEARIVREKFLGMTKSLIAISG
ncbi:MAG: methyltransferase type 11, partial [Candidatus Binataceae bacterium]